jgi:hypothetical protein
MDDVFLSLCFHVENCLLTLDSKVFVVYPIQDVDMPPLYGLPSAIDALKRRRNVYYNSLKMGNHACK